MQICGAFSALVLVGLAGALRGSEPDNPGYTVSVISTMTKVRRDEHGPVRRGLDVKLTAARGEGESAQLLIQANQPLKGVKVSATPLEGPDGQRLPLELLRVWYVPIKNPTPVGFGKQGPYPDPLVPMRSFDVAAGESQGIWVTCWVPRDAVPGDYRGRITIQPKGAAATEIDVAVGVSTAQLPVVPALRTSFDYWKAGDDEMWYGKEGWKDREGRFLDDLRRYRISTPPVLPWAGVFHKEKDGTWTARWDEFDRQVERWRSKGAAFFMLRREVIPWYGREVPREIADRDAIAAKLRLLDAHLEEKGWSDRFGFYLFDEPILSADWPKAGDTQGPENVEAIKAIGRFLHEHAPHLRMIIVACDPVYESVALDQPTYIWCPHINHFNATFQVQRQQLGEQNWMYVCMTTWKSSFPDMWRIDRPGTSHRAVGSWLWRYQCDGFLFWCVDYWRKNPFETPDIFAEAVNGDGFLFYPDPGKKYDPCPSMRAALMRDGFEDYELLSLVRSAAQALVSAGPTLPPAKQAAAGKWLASARQLLNVEDVIPATNRFSEDAADYENRHRRLLRLLDALEADVGAEILRLTNPAVSP
ncbi:MAG: glycoside hydrolase domain-containing protein [Planctomycetia bacterium]